MIAKTLIDTQMFFFFSHRQFRNNFLQVTITFTIYVTFNITLIFLTINCLASDIVYGYLVYICTQQQIIPSEVRINVI